MGYSVKSRGRVSFGLIGQRCETVVKLLLHSSTLPIRASLIPLFDLFFQTSIFFHAVSPRCFGLVPPMSLDGGVVGGVIGSLPGHGMLMESSVKFASQWLPKDCLGDLWPLLGLTVRLEVEEGGGLEEWWKVNMSDEEDGDARRRERLRFSFRFVEVCRFGAVSISILLVSSTGDCDSFGDGTSFKNATNTDSSIKLYIILRAASSSSGRGGTTSFGSDNNISRTLLGILISRDPSGTM